MSLKTSLRAPIQAVALFLVALVPQLSWGVSYFYHNMEARVAVLVDDERPCGLKEVVDKLKPELKQHVRGGSANVEGIMVEICWFDSSKVNPKDPGNVYITDLSMQILSLPLKLFRKLEVY